MEEEEHFNKPLIRKERNQQTITTVCLCRPAGQLSPAAERPAGCQDSVSGGAAPCPATHTHTQDSPQSRTA